jgi:outer membrane biosynthesis protein TonB
LFLLTIFPNFQLFATPPKPVPDPQPIVLEFAKPKPELPNKFWELYENPNANEQIPEQADILSTQSSISAAPIQDQLKSDAPKSDPIDAHKANETNERAEEVIDLQGNEPIYAFNQQRKFSKNLLTGKERAPETESEENQTKTTDKVSKEFDAKLVGDFVLSTYEWEWAPWWLEFKRKLYRVWVPPVAFSMGLISGYTIIYVKINRNSEILDYKVLKHEGHHTLQESSVGAILSSFPFKPLPEDFPENYLEVRLILGYRLKEN